MSAVGLIELVTATSRIHGRLQEVSSKHIIFLRTLGIFLIGLIKNLCFISPFEISNSVGTMSGLPKAILDALEFERATRVKGSVLDDPFYQCPSGSSQATRNTLLKVKKDINTTPYLIPAGTALSKFVYQSEKLNGAPVPVSGFILWPYATRSYQDGYPVVA